MGVDIVFKKSKSSRGGVNISTHLGAGLEIFLWAESEERATFLLDQICPGWIRVFNLTATPMEIGLSTDPARKPAYAKGVPHV